MSIIHRSMQWNSLIQSCTKLPTADSRQATGDYRRSAQLNQLDCVTSGNCSLTFGLIFRILETDMNKKLEVSR